MTVLEITATPDIVNTEPVLCYIRGQWAFFTTQKLSEQWGSDWSDAPYEHNSEDPNIYDENAAKRGKKPWTITRIAFECDLETPDTWVLNSPWSVQDINNKETPWLSSGKCGKRGEDNEPIEIWAGTTLSEFIHIVQGIGGTIYTRLPENEEEQRA